MFNRASSLDLLSYQYKKEMGVSHFWDFTEAFGILKQWFGDTHYLSQNCAGTVTALCIR